MSNTAARVKPLPRLGAPQGAASVHLDALRGIAAVGVCLNHVRDIFFRDYSQLSHHNPLLALAYLATGLGHQWVIIFFVLSGYLVGGSALRSTPPDAGPGTATYLTDSRGSTLCFCPR